MVTRLRHNGFSLVEVMLSAGILAIGFMLIAGAFPVGAKLTALATERTIGMAAAEEAFAKIQLYGVDFSSPNWPSIPIFSPIPEQTRSVKFNFIADAGINLDLDLGDFPNQAAMDAAYAKAFEEYNYPSTHLVDNKKYRWSALCRYLGGYQLQATVFVCRLTGLGVEYPEVDDDGSDDILGTVDDYALTGFTTTYPTALRMRRVIPASASPAELDNIIDIDVNPANLNIPAGFNMTEYVKYVTVGSTIVDGRTGELMYVTDREGAKITLLDTVNERQFGSYFWVIPPSVRPENRSVNGRSPCVAVYQRKITF